MHRPDLWRLLTRTLQLTALARLLGLNRHARRLTRSRLYRFWIVAALALTLPWLAHSYMAPQTGDRLAGECRVLRVVDGDGVRLDCGPGRENLNVRLYCIDAPETSQAPWGDRSTQHLLSMLGPTVALERMDTDRYGRTIGRLISDGRDLNLQMVADGQAAVYRQFCSERKYYAAERQAREAGVGIWAVPGLHQAPWEYRRR